MKVLYHRNEIHQKPWEPNIKFKITLKLEKVKKKIRNDNDELVVENFPKKKQPDIQQPK